MDPQACLDRLISAISSNDPEEVESAREDLATWLRRGGFAPVVSGGDLQILLMAICPQEV